MNRQHGGASREGRCISDTGLLLAPIELRRRPIAAVLAAGVFLWANAAGAVPTVTETGSAITVDNGLISFRVDKSNGSIDSIVLGGQELLGGGGLLYQDANDDAYWRLGVHTAASYAVTTGADYADVSLSTAASSAMPADFTVHYVLRDGETGLHIYLELTHTRAMAELDLAQTRAVLRADPSLFDHHSVTDARFGIMPTPAELDAGTKVQDATTQLNPGTAYEAETGRAEYTKYDWSLDERSREVIGTTGDDYGAWIVEPHRESHPGGPWKQNLTVEQTTTTPVLLLMWASQHYGTPGRIVLSGDESRVYGPKYLHLNTGPDLSTMRADAKTWDDRSVHRSFYDSLGIPGWVTSENLADVSGDLSIAGSGPLENATIVLSDDGREFQFSQDGYVYYTTTDAAGAFSLADVRPGTYRLSAVAPGIYGEFTLDGVVASAGTPLYVGSLQWTPPDAGSDLWQVGVFDRTAEEFRHGAADDYRRWGLWFDYPLEFPSDVHFVIGTSDEAVDWNYAHFERTTTTPSPTCTASGTSPEWEIEFSGVGVPANRVATLTVAVAGQRGAVLEVLLNGDSIGTWALPHDGSIIHRSGIRGAYQSHQFSFDTDLLQAETNTLTLRHPSPGSSCTEGILYDALLLEIGGEECSDGLDNDGDGLTDLADPGCVDGGDLSERDPTLPCDDGADNDGDGGIDFDPVTKADPAFQAGSGDPGCFSPTYLTETPQCQDGINNDVFQDPTALIDFDGGQSIHGACSGGVCPPGVSDPNSDGVADPDPECVGKPWGTRETIRKRRCGLGFELVLVLPPLMWLHRRRRM